MNALLSASLFVLSPLLAAVLPYLADRVGLSRRLSSRKLRLPMQRGFGALPQAPAEPDPKGRMPWRYAFEGAVLTAGVVVGISIAVSTSTHGQNLGVVVMGNLLGLTLGVTVLVGLRLVNRAYRGMFPCDKLHQLGLHGVWSSEDPVPFKRELLRAVKEAGTIEVLTADGVDMLTALSHPAHDPLSVPHSSLRGGRIKLLILPPQSRRMDPVERGRTTSEVSLSRLGQSPEDHWRQLSTTMEVKERWENDYGVVVEVMFLENRPSFEQVTVGVRTWFRPWTEKSTWIETRNDPDRRRLFSAIRMQHAEAVASASPEMNFVLAAGPTKTTFIRNGVEVPTQRPPSTLQVEEEAELQS